MLLKLVQKKYFGDELVQIKQGKTASEKLIKLSPFVDTQGILRVGGRLEASEFDEGVKHPILMPKESNVSRAIIRWCQINVGHGGRNSTLQELRSRGFWIISANSCVRSEVFRCVQCRKLNGKVGQQYMSDLPKERLSLVPMFTHCGVDMFGPFIIKRGRAEVKRYGAMFTCLSSRAIHIEVSHSLGTDSFILALRRVIARRGAIRTIRSDNGTNFIGASEELKRNFLAMDHTKIAQFLSNNGGDWLVWKFNPPKASHFGGVWERQIRSARRILNSILASHPGILTDESLLTVMTEVEAIVNSRPLTVESLNDPNSLQPISPYLLLTHKTKCVMPPAGHFESPDLYSRKQWRRVQHLAEEFWSRWRKEFLFSLQERKVWSTKRRNFQVGDVVLMKEETTRSTWPMARVVEVYPDNKGLVRTVKLKTDAYKEPLRRPISKIVLVLENDSPTRSQSQ